MAEFVLLAIIHMSNYVYMLRFIWIIAFRADDNMIVTDKITWHLWGITPKFHAVVMLMNINMKKKCFIQNLYVSL
jgi:hypothetical protein